MVERDKLVSIIIPIHNGAAYIEDCIQSLIKQTYSSIEIILVNDGSVDASELICRRWVNKDRRIKYYFQRNKGVSEARNYGMLHSSGNYIAFVDVDDTCECEFVENLMAIMHRDNCDVVFGGFYRCNLIEKCITEQHGTELKNSVPYEAGLQLGAEKYDCGVWGKIYKRRALVRDGKMILFDNRFQIGEDYIWLIHVLKNCTHISATSSCLYRYNVRRGSASHSLLLNERNLSHLKALEYCLNIKRIEEIGCKEDIEYRLFAQIRIFELLAHMENNRDYLAYINQLVSKYNWLRGTWYRNRKVPYVSKIKQAMMDMIFKYHLDARIALYVYNFKRKEKLTAKQSN